MTRIEIQTGDIHTLHPSPPNRASVLVSFVTQKREFCITCVCSAYYKPVSATESVHELFLPERLSNLNHQIRFPRDYHNTYTFSEFLFIVWHLASLSPALPNLWLLLVIIIITFWKRVCTIVVTFNGNAGGRRVTTPCPWHELLRG